jgi:hypothetical protein
MCVRAKVRARTQSDLGPERGAVVLDDWVDEGDPSDLPRCSSNSNPCFRPGFQYQRVRTCMESPQHREWCQQTSHFDEYLSHRFSYSCVHPFRAAARKHAALRRRYLLIARQSNSCDGLHNPCILTRTDPTFTPFCITLHPIYNVFTRGDTPVR